MSDSQTAATAEPAAADAFAAAAAAVLGAAAMALECRPGEIAFEVPADGLLGAARALRDHPALRVEMCMDVCGVDFLHYGQAEWKTNAATASGFSRGVARGGASEPDAPAAGRRFAVVYNLLSVVHNRRLRLRVYCADDAQPMVDSVTGIWASANWFEREAFDLYGIMFRGHPDLRRILTDYGFIGHPFRKDFPLSGNVEVRYDPEKGRIVYEPVSIEPRTLVPKVIRHDNRYDPQLTNAKTNG
ncbi:MAG: NADH-quinone oxidoreductase subunit C [Gammaproteobacteria bacterium]|nr:NADH-quinone oxidoreductase subunit C [Gammaproteobacteria bacterium]